MAYNEQAKKATLKYIKDKTQQFTIRFSQSDYDERIKPVIEASGMKPTTFIRQAVEEKIARDAAEKGVSPKKAKADVALTSAEKKQLEKYITEIANRILNEQ